MSEVAQNESTLINSGIFWRITIGIFISILLIEGALLVFSWFTERDRQLAKIEGSLASVVAVLDHSNPAPQLNRLLSSHDNTNNLTITGYQYTDIDGKSHSAGDTNNLSELVSATLPRHFITSTATLSSFKQTNDGSVIYRIRTDASWVKSYMRGYVMRILIMVMMISLFVTCACLVILTPTLIKPLQRLNQLLISGQESGIQSAAPEHKDLSRTDEIGSVFNSLELLRHRVLASEKDNSQITSRFEAFANMGADCFWETDKDTRITYIAGDVHRLFCLSAEEITGLTSAEFVDRIQDRVDHPEQLKEALWKNGTWEGEIRSSLPDTEPASVRILTEPQSTSGKIDGYRGTITDISKEAALAKELKHQATHDFLTGLPNRRELTQQLTHSIEQYSQDGIDFSLIIIDLDRFKTVNDSCGHTAGDRLIKNLATQLTSIIEDRDIVARIGGDEFAILLCNSDINRSHEVAERIRCIVEDYKFYWNGQPHRVSASIGVAQAANDLITQEALIFAADSCCIKAKKNGKNQVQLYSNQDTTLSVFRDEALWISRILWALENEGFALFRQSIVPVVNDKNENHFEILIRMKNDEGGFWAPFLFLEAAERNDLMPKIDQWVVYTSLDWLSRQEVPDDEGFCMNINLSGASLSDVNFREFLLERVKNNEKFNRYICFEITETTAMAHYEETIALLDNLRDHGCQVALDDFGTGFSSLAHIKDLPIDYIKIDGVFIKNILDNQLDQTVVNSVAEIANVLGIKTVAEFVETESILQMIKKMKIDYAQGFLFSKPEALDQPAEDTDHKKAA